MAISRRELTRLVAGTGALAAISQLGRAVSVAQTAVPYRAMVGVFLFGGSDGWNMLVPTDGRYGAYAAARTSNVALPQASLVPLAGTPFGLHPSMAALKPVWEEGALNVVMNTGSLLQPLDRGLYQSRPDLRPLNLMSHADEQAHWQGLRVREDNTIGFMGRIADKMPVVGGLPPLVSLSGSNLAIIGARSQALILPSSGQILRNGYNPTATDRANVTRIAAFNAFADGSPLGPMTGFTGQAMSAAYDMSAAANWVVSNPSGVDAYFKNPTTGATLTSDIAKQFMRVARMIEQHTLLNHTQQVFFVSQGGYDTHEAQVAGDGTAGTHANLLADLAMALAGFHNAMKALNLAQSVTSFTMSDFGRVYKGNAQRGTDHAWGSNHLVVGGGLKAPQLIGRYPDQVLGGPEDAGGDGRWIPSIAVEEYLGAIAQWWGVNPVDMPYVFPNWATWAGGGRGPVPLFA